MPKYHFIQGKETGQGIEIVNGLPVPRITALYGQTEFKPFGNLASWESYFGVAGGKAQGGLEFGNCEGSLMLIARYLSTSENPLNKLHIGDLDIKRPHIESREERGDAGPRVDLWEFDIEYASNLWNELVLWRDPRHRKTLLAEYATYHWYCVPHRVKQLGISQAGLERKLEELNEHIERLKRNPDRRLVSTLAHQIESQCLGISALMRDRIERESISAAQIEQLSKRQKLKPKVIENAADVYAVAMEIGDATRRIFDFVRPRVDIARARNYWQEVDAWGNL